MQPDSLLELVDDDQKREEAIARIEEANAVEATKQANAILKKHRREIKRLNEHAQGAVLENNFEAYKYAITKLRALYRQPATDELIVTMWKTTRRQIWDIINAHSEKV